MPALPKLIVESVVVPNRYFDSVSLMRVAKGLAGQPGISQAAAIMATPRNLQVLASAGYEGVESVGASPNDLIVSLKADTLERARAVLGSLEGWLERGSGEPGAASARSLDHALSIQPGSNLALISVPGEYAAREAQGALEKGLNVFLFSDNVPLEDEVSLKVAAREKGLLVMGPDCGTSIIAGVGIGFANAVRPGPIGVVGASGTGIQEVTTLVHRMGSGISHAIGTGSRDMSDAVGGLSALQALDALEADSATSVIVLVSKPPGTKTLETLDSRIAACSKPVVTCFLGVPAGSFQASGGTVTRDLDAVASAAVVLASGSGVQGEEPAQSGIDARNYQGDRQGSLVKAGQRYIRGIFAGGTFCYQAQQVLLEAGVEVHSNEPLEGARPLADAHSSVGHTLVDMGADEFTRGRPHPMIDSSTRAQRVLAEAGDPEVAVLLLDFILGYNASEDPTGELAPAILRARKLAGERGSHLAVVASVCGTSQDPQGLEAQTRRLEEAGVILLPSSFKAAGYAASLVAGRA